MIHDGNGPSDRSMSPHDFATFMDEARSLQGENYSCEVYSKIPPQTTSAVRTFDKLKPMGLTRNTNSTQGLSPAPWEVDVPTEEGNATRDGSQSFAARLKQRGHVPPPLSLGDKVNQLRPRVTIVPPVSPLSPSALQRKPAVPRQPEPKLNATPVLAAVVSPLSGTLDTTPSIPKEFCKHRPRPSSSIYFPSHAPTTEMDAYLQRMPGNSTSIVPKRDALRVENDPHHLTVGQESIRTVERASFETVLPTSRRSRGWWNVVETPFLSSTDTHTCTRQLAETHQTIAPRKPARDCAICAEHNRTSDVESNLHTKLCNCLTGTEGSLSGRSGDSEARWSHQYHDLEEKFTPQMQISQPESSTRSPSSSETSESPSSVYEKRPTQTPRKAGRPGLRVDITQLQPGRVPIADPSGGHLERHVKPSEAMEAIHKKAAPVGRLASIDFFGVAADAISEKGRLPNARTGSGARRLGMGPSGLVPHSDLLGDLPFNEKQERAFGRKGHRLCRWQGTLYDEFDPQRSEKRQRWCLIGLVACFVVVTFLVLILAMTVT